MWWGCIMKAFHLHCNCTMAAASFSMAERSFYGFLSFPEKSTSDLPSWLRVVLMLSEAFSTFSGVLLLIVYTDAFTTLFFRVWKISATFWPLGNLFLPVWWYTVLNPVIINILCWAIYDGVYLIGLMFQIQLTLIK